MYWNVPTIVPSAVSGPAIVGECVSVGDARRCRPGRRRRAREAEVHELGAGLGEHDVAGLEVAVDDAGAVRAVERVGDLRADAQHVGERQRPAREARGQRLALDQLHHQVVGVALAADVVQRADVRMVEARDRLRLALEARAHSRDWQRQVLRAAP